MFENIKILNTMSAMAQHAQKRHSVIAQNIANADTPDYVAKDLKPFSEIYSQNASKDLKQTITAIKPIEISSFDAKSPNGNSVSLEEQSIKAVDAKMDHEMALTIYRKVLDLMKLAASKNI